jgi:hypothetical protein
MDRSLWQRGCSSNAADLTIAAKEANNNLFGETPLSAGMQFAGQAIFGVRVPAGRLHMSLLEGCTSQLHQLCEMS